MRRFMTRFAGPTRKGMGRGRRGGSSIPVPSWTSTPAPTFTAYQSGSYSIANLVTGETSITLIGTLPAGITFNGTSLVASGAQTAGTTSGLTFRATNSSGYADSTAFSVVVVNPAPAWSQVPTYSLTEGAPLSSQPVSVSAGGAPITVTWVSGVQTSTAQTITVKPGWITFSAASATPTVSFSGHVDADDMTGMVWRATVSGVPPVDSSAGSITVAGLPSGDYYVSTLAQLQSAVDGANLQGGNTTIWVAAGTYTLPASGDLQIAAPNITIRSQSGNRDDVVIRGDAFASSPGTYGSVFRVTASGFALRNLTVGRCRWHAVQLVGETGTTNGSLFSNVRFYDCYEQMLKGTTNGTAGAESGLVEDCLFEYTAGIGPQYYIGGIDVHRARNWIVRRSTFRNIISPSSSVAEYAVHFWNGAQDNLVERCGIFNCDRAIGFGLMSQASGSGGTIKNNYVYRSAAGTGSFADNGIDVQNCTGVSVYNNTVYHETAGPAAIDFRGTTTGGLVRNNLTNQPVVTSVGGTFTSSNNVTTAQAAYFVDRTTGPTLASSVSGVVNAGVTIATVTDDFDGTVRPQGASYDIGADEYIAPPSDATPPSQVTGLTATAASSSAINLGWSAATDNVAVTGYDVQRATDSGFTLNVVTTDVGNVLTYSATGLGASTTYYFRVRAKDAASNLGTWSSSANATTQASGGSLLDLPLLQSNQISYLGTVTIPNATEYPAAAIGWGGVSGTNRQFIAAHGNSGSYQMRRFNLPASTGTATSVQGPTTPVLSGFNNQSDIRVYGTLQINGKVLYACSADYNGGGGSQSAFVSAMSPSNFASRTTPQGTSGLPAYNPGMRSIVGWFAEIPTEWQSTLNDNDVFCGTNCKSIVSNDMIGPGFVAFKSSAVTGSGTIPTDKWMIWGHGDGPTEYMLWLGNGRYGAGENVNTAGAAIIPGTRTLLYFGHQGTGSQVYNTGTGDPCNPYQGDHAYPYEFQAWAFDMSDIVAVKNGTMQPYQPRPYATRTGTNGWNFFGWKLNGPTDSCQRVMYTSGFYDYGTNRIYMGRTDGSVLHVWQVNV